LFVLVMDVVIIQVCAHVKEDTLVMLVKCGHATLFAYMETVRRPIIVLAIVGGMVTFVINPSATIYSNLELVHLTTS